MRKKRLLWQLYPAYLLIMLVSLTAVAWYASSALRTFDLEQTKADLEARALLVEDLFLLENGKIRFPADRCALQRTGPKGIHADHGDSSGRQSGGRFG